MQIESSVMLVRIKRFLLFPMFGFDGTLGKGHFIRIGIQNMCLGFGGLTWQCSEWGQHKVGSKNGQNADGTNNI